jgi:ferric-dicitrate binding protein FerR (iron transport regulator)
MEDESELVESLIHRAGRRIEPPAEAYRQVFAAAQAALREKTTRQRNRVWVMWAGAAAMMILVVTRWAPPVAQQNDFARVERMIGGVEVATGDIWRPLAEARVRLAAGTKIRTLEDGRGAFLLAGGESLRLDANTQVSLEAPGRLYFERGTIYVDSGPQSIAKHIEVVTPAGTARDLGTQFELQVAGAALRLRVREGSVSIERGDGSMTGTAGDQITIDARGAVSRDWIASDSEAWQWAESIAPTSDMDGKPAADLIAWVARETGRRLRYASPVVEQRAATVILHGNVRHLAPLVALEAMLATTDLECALRGDTMEIRSRDTPPLDP